MTSTGSPREEGFYWVRLACAEGLPVIAEWRFSAWLFAGTGEPVRDGLVEVLGERLVFAAPTDARAYYTPDACQPPDDTFEDLARYAEDAATNLNTSGARR